MGSSRVRLGAVVSKVKIICQHLPKGREISHVVTLSHECETNIGDSVNAAMSDLGCTLQHANSGAAQYLTRFSSSLVCNHKASI